MDFRNITPFNRFRKTFEEVVAGDEFSNKTGFAESLVGRGIFSIFRYIKQGIDMIRLEYLKRKLENEYFAGFLRFCSVKKINLKDGTMPKGDEGDESGDESGNGGGGGNEEDNAACEIFSIPWPQNNYIATYSGETEKYMNEMIALKEEGVDEEDAADIDKLIDNAKKMMNYFRIKEEQNIIYARLDVKIKDAGETKSFEGENLTDVVRNLQGIINFLKGDARICPTFNLGEDEKSLINKLAAFTNEEIKAKCKEITDLIKAPAAQAPAAQAPAAQAPAPVAQAPAHENFSYDMINEEAISSSINTKVPIMQMLGDSLNIMPDGASGVTSHKVNAYEYLKGIGINSVDEINFKACADVWADNPEFKDQCSKMVSVDGIKRLQYAAARIIYRIKKTPTGTGMTPAVGGAVNFAEDSALRSVWERKIETVKGEWTYFMNVEAELDPFRIQNLQDAMRARDARGDALAKESQTYASDIKDVGEWDKIGLNIVKGTYRENQPIVVKCSFNDDANVAYLLCVLHTNKFDKTRSVYRYLGNIKIDQILKDKAYEKTGFKFSDYSSCILTDKYITEYKGSVELNNFMKLNLSSLKTFGSGFYLNGIYLSTNDFKRFDMSANLKTCSTKIMYFYVNNGKNAPFSENPPSFTPSNTNLKMKYVYNNSVQDATSLTNLKDDIKPIKWKIGAMATFQPSWLEKYFPGLSNNIILQGNDSKIPSIVNDAYSKVIIIKTK